MNALALVRRFVIRGLTAQTEMRGLTHAIVQVATSVMAHTVNGMFAACALNEVREFEYIVVSNLYSHDSQWLINDNSVRE